MSLREYIGCAVVFAAVIISQLDLGALLAGKKKDALGESAEADTNSEAR
jgi:hypothetical protein